MISGNLSLVEPSATVRGPLGFFFTGYEALCFEIVQVITEIVVEYILQVSGWNPGRYIGYYLWVSSIPVQKRGILLKMYEGHILSDPFQLTLQTPS